MANEKKKKKGQQALSVVNSVVDKVGQAVNKTTGQSIPKQSSVSQSTPKQNSALDAAARTAKVAIKAVSDYHKEANKPVNKKWYSGETPTNRETIARMYKIADGDKSRFSELYKMYETETANKGSVIYNPYTQATNTKAIEGLTALGYDVSDVDGFLANNKWLLNYGRETTTAYGAHAPTKSSTDLQDAAYWYSELYDAQERTTSAQNEMSQLASDIKYLTDRGYSDTAVINQIKRDFSSNYKTLSTMDENRIAGSASILNKAVNYNGDDTLYGMIWAARNNDESGDYFGDSVKYTMGIGNKYVYDANSEAARDPSNYEAYNPYVLGSTVEKWNKSTSTNMVDDDSLEANRWMLNGTDDEIKAWQSAYQANENTKAAKTELEALDAWIENQVSRGKDAATINAQLTAMIDPEDGDSDSDYATLAKMESKRKMGTYLDLGDSVNFTLPSYKAKVEELVKERDEQLAQEAAEKAREEELKDQTASGWDWFWTRSVGEEADKVKDIVATADPADSLQKYMNENFGVNISEFTEDELTEWSALRDAVFFAKTTGSKKGNAERLADEFYDKAAEWAQSDRASTWHELTLDPEKKAAADAKKAEEAAAEAAATFDYKNTAAYKYVFSDGAEEPREGMAQGEVIKQSYAISAGGGGEVNEAEQLAKRGKANAEAEWDKDAQTYISMCQGGQWDSMAYSWALDQTDNDYAIQQELYSNINAIRSGKLSIEEAGLAGSWWNQFGHLFDTHDSMAGYEANMNKNGWLGGAANLIFSSNAREEAENYDPNQNYGETIYGYIQNVRNAKDIGAIDNTEYTKRMVDLSRYTEIIDGMSEKEGNGLDPATSEQILDQLGNVKDTINEWNSTLEGDIASQEKKNTETREAKYTQVREIVGNVANGGELGDDDYKVMLSAMGEVDISEAGKNDSVYQEMQNVITDGLTSDSLQARGFYDENSGYETNAELANLYAEGAGKIAQARLDQDMKFAAACGMSLEEYYAAYPNQAKTGESILASALQEYEEAYDVEFLQSSLGDLMAANSQIDENLASGNDVADQGDQTQSLVMSDKELKKTIRGVNDDKKSASEANMTLLEWYNLHPERKAEVAGFTGMVDRETGEVNEEAFDKFLTDNAENIKYNTDNAIDPLDNLINTINSSLSTTESIGLGVDMGLNNFINGWAKTAYNAITMDKNDALTQETLKRQYAGDTAAYRADLEKVISGMPDGKRKEALSAALEATDDIWSLGLQINSLNIQSSIDSIDADNAAKQELIALYGTSFDKFVSEVTANVTTSVAYMAETTAIAAGLAPAVGGTVGGLAGSLIASVPEGSDVTYNLLEQGVDRTKAYLAGTATAVTTGVTEWGMYMNFAGTYIANAKWRTLANDFSIKMLWENPKAVFEGFGGLLYKTGTSAFEEGFQEGVQQEATNIFTRAAKGEQLIQEGDAEDFLETMVKTAPSSIILGGFGGAINHLQNMGMPYYDEQGHMVEYSEAKLNDDFEGLVVNYGIERTVSQEAIASVSEEISNITKSTEWQSRQQAKADLETAQKALTPVQEKVTQAQEAETMVSEALQNATAEMVNADVVTAEMTDNITKMNEQLAAATEARAKAEGELAVAQAQVTAATNNFNNLDRAIGKKFSDLLSKAKEKARASVMDNFLSECTEEQAAAYKDYLAACTELQAAKSQLVNASAALNAYGGVAGSRANSVTETAYGRVANLVDKLSIKVTEARAKVDTAFANEALDSARSRGLVDPKGVNQVTEGTYNAIDVGVEGLAAQNNLTENVENVSQEEAQQVAQEASQSAPNVEAVADNAEGIASEAATKAAENATEAASTPVSPSNETETTESATEVEAEAATPETAAETSDAVTEAAKENVAEAKPAEAETEVKAEAKADTKDLRSDAEKKAEESAKKAAENPTNARLQMQADADAKVVKAEKAEAALEEARPQLVNDLMSRDKTVRDAALKQYNTLKQNATMARDAATKAQEHFNATSISQSNLRSAIEEFKQFDNDALTDEEHPKHEAAQAAYDELQEALMMADIADAKNSLDLIVNGLNADNADSISVYRNAEAKLKELMAAKDTWTGERSTRRTAAVNAALKEGGLADLAAAITNRESRENVIGSLEALAKGDPKAAERLRSIAGLNNTTAEIIINDETGVTGENGLTRAYSEETTELTQEQEDQLTILDELGKQAGLEIVIHPTVSNVQGAVNGTYTSGNAVHIGLDSIEQGYVQAGFHEVTHWISKNNASAFEGLSSTVFDALRKNGVDVDALVQDRIDQYARSGKPISEAAAREEIVAESAGMVLTDPVNMKRFAESNQGAFKHTMQRFLQFWSKLKGIAERIAGKNQRGEMQALMGKGSTLRIIYDNFMSAARATGVLMQQQRQTADTVQVEETHDTVDALAEAVEAIGKMDNKAETATEAVEETAEGTVTEANPNAAEIAERQADLQKLRDRMAALRNELEQEGLSDERKQDIRDTLDWLEMDEEDLQDEIEFLQNGEVSGEQAVMEQVQDEDVSEEQVQSDHASDIEFDDSFLDKKYSLNVFPDGQKYVEVDTNQELFDGKNLKGMKDAATEYIHAAFPKGTVISETIDVQAGKRAEGEYVYPRKKVVPTSKYKAKLRASTELSNLLDASTYDYSAPDGKDGHWHSNTQGWEYYKAKFRVGEQWYEGKVNVRITKDGERLFHDITEIKNITRQIAGLYGNDIPHAAWMPGNSQALSGDALSVSQDDSTVNTPSGYLNEKSSGNQGDLSLNTGLLDAQRERDTRTAINYIVDQLMNNGENAVKIAQALGEMGVSGITNFVNGTGSTQTNSNISALISDTRDSTGKDRDAANRNDSARTGNESGTVRNPVQILRGLTESLGVGYNPGGQMTSDGRRNINRAVLGFYNNLTRGITSRTTEAGDLAVGLHEFGHALQQRLQNIENPDGSGTVGLSANESMVNALPEAFRQNYGAAEIDGEAVSEFICDYMYSRDLAVETAGEEYVRNFERMLRSDPAALRAMTTARNQVTLWSNASTGAKIKAMTSETTVYKQRKSGLSGLLRELNRGLFDYAAPAKMVSEDFHRSAQWAAKSSSMGERCLTADLVDPQGNVIGDGLSTRLANAGVTRNQYEEVSQYALARHAIDRNAQGTPVFDAHEITNEELQAYCAEVEANSPQIVAAADALTSFWNDFYDAWYVETGMLGENGARIMKELREKYPHYVPTYRVQDANFAVKGGGSRFQMRAARGSSLEVVNPIYSFVNMTQQVVNTVSQNEINRQFHQAMQEGGFDWLATQEAPDMQMFQVNTGTLEGQIADLFMNLTEDGAMPDTAQFEDIFNTIQNMQEQWRSTGWRNGGKNIISGIDENGQRFFYKIKDKGMYELLSGNAKAMGNGMKLARALKNAFTKLTTGSNPLFAIKNAQRDFQNSVNTGSWATTYVDGAAKWIGAMYDVVTKGEAYQEYMNMGGGNSTRYSAETDAQAKALADAIFTKGGLTPKKVVNALVKTMTLQQVNETVETTSRLAEYKYGKHDRSTFEGRQEAFMAAQDVTTNFGTHGAWGWVKAVNSAIPFCNATMQGVAKDLNILKNAFNKDGSIRARSWKSIGKTVMNVGLTAALQAALLGAFSDGDDDDRNAEEYAMASEEMRAGNLLIRVPDSLIGDSGFDRPYIRIPIAQDPLSRAVYAASLGMFSNLTDMDELSVDMYSVAQSIVNDSVPDGSIYTTYFDVKNNKTWYGGDIVNSYTLKRSTPNQYNTDTIDLFKEASNALYSIGIEVSPAVMQYVAEQYTGFVGKIAIPALSGNKYTGERSLEQSLRNVGYSVLKNYTLDPVVSSDITNDYKAAKTVATSIQYDSQNGDTVNALHSSLGEYEIEEAVDEAAKAQKKGGYFYDTDKEINALWEEISSIQQSSLTDAEKAQQIREIRYDMDNLMLDALEEWSIYKMYYIDHDPLAMSATNTIRKGTN